VYKKGNKSDPSNYRLISLTSIICKLMQSIIRDHIMHFFRIRTLAINRIVYLFYLKQIYCPPTSKNYEWLDYTVGFWGTNWCHIDWLCKGIWYCLSLQTSSMVDLGDRFDNNLTFRNTCLKKIIRLYSVLAIIKKILFIWMNIHSFYCIKQWSAHTRRYQRDRKSPEKSYKTDN